MGEDDVPEEQLRLSHHVLPALSPYHGPGPGLAAAAAGAHGAPGPGGPLGGDPARADSDRSLGGTAPEASSVYLGVHLLARRPARPRPPPAPEHPTGIMAPPVA